MALNKLGGRSMKKEYDTFVETLQDLPQGQETELTIRDLTPGRSKYDGRCVRAVVSPSRDELPEGDVLWIRFYTGVLHPQPWAVKIIQELGEYLAKREAVT
jgi:hypothetical protein